MSRSESSPELYAATVNGLVVLFGPLAGLFVLWLLVPPPGNRVTAYVTPLSQRLAEGAVVLAVFVSSFAPFAIVSAWRTWVHARAYRLSEGRGWQGVLESGAVGFAFALMILGWGIIHRPSEAPPYVLFYGGAAILVGLTVGLVLRFIAIAVLTLTRPAKNAEPHIEP